MKTAEYAHEIAKSLRETANDLDYFAAAAGKNTDPNDLLRTLLSVVANPLRKTTLSDLVLRAKWDYEAIEDAKDEPTEEPTYDNRVI